MLTAKVGETITICVEEYCDSNISPYVVVFMNSTQYMLLTPESSMNCSNQKITFPNLPEGKLEFMVHCIAGSDIKVLKTVQVIVEASSITSETTTKGHTTSGMHVHSNFVLALIFVIIGINMF